MTLVTEISLSQLYSCEEDLYKAVVLKDLPDNSDDLDFLTNYLDVVLGEDGNLIHVCQPIPIPSTLIVIFDQAIQDVEKYRSTLDRRKCKGKRIILEKIGLPMGVFLRHLPTNVDEEFLHLYFESKKKCGHHCEVNFVKVKVTGVTRVAVVAITEVAATRAILTQPHHTMRSQEVLLEPYFPPYHDYLLEHLPEPQQHTKNIGLPEEDIPSKARLVIIETAKNEPESQDNLETQLDDTLTTADERQHKQEVGGGERDMHHDLVDSTNVSHEDDEVKLVKNYTILVDKTSNSQKQNEDFLDNKDNKDCGDDCYTNTAAPSNATAVADDDDDGDCDDEDGDDEDDDDKECRTDILKVHKSEHQPGQTKLDTEKFQSVPYLNQTEESVGIPEVVEEQASADVVSQDYIKPAERMRPARLLDCIIEDGDLLEPIIQQKVIESKYRPQTQHSVSRFAENVSNSQVHKIASPIAETHNTPCHKEPIFQGRQTKNNTSETARPMVAMVKPSFSQNNNYKGKTPSHGREKKPELKVESELMVSASKIMLLKISKYGYSPTQNIKIILNENQGKVVIKGSNSNDVNDEKLKLYETLEGIVERTANLTKHRSDFLGQKECVDHIKFISKKNGLKVVITVDAANSQLVCVALSEESAHGGLQMVQDRINSQSIKLRQGQLEILTGTKWQQIMDSVKGSLITVYISGSKEEVVVEGFKKRVEIAEVRQKVVQFLKENVVKATTKIELNGAKAKCFQRYLQLELKTGVQQKHGTLTVDVVKRDYPMKISLCIQGEISVSEYANSVLAQIYQEKFDFQKVIDSGLEMWLLMKGLNGKHGRPFFKKFGQEHNCCIDVTEAGEVAPPSVEVKQHVVSQPSPSPVHTRDNGDSPEMYDVPRQRSRPAIYSSLQHEHLTAEEALEKATLNSLQDMRTSLPQDHSTGLLVVDEDQDWEPVFPTMPISPNRNKYSKMPAPAHTFYGDSCSDDDVEDDNVQDEERSFSVKIANIDLTLEKGDITKCQADCLVNFVGPSGKLEEGAVSKCILRAAGSQLNMEYQNNRQAAGGTIIETSAGRLKCRKVFHVQLTKGPQNCARAVQMAVSQILNLCVSNDYSSIVFPPLGIGRMYQYPVAAVAKAMLQGIKSSLPDLPNIDVTVVVYDDETFSQFKIEYQNFQTSQPVSFISGFNLRKHMSSRPLPNPRPGSFSKVHGFHSASRVRPPQQATPSQKRSLEGGFSSRPLPSPPHARRQRLPTQHLKQSDKIRHSKSSDEFLSHRQRTEPHKVMREEPVSFKKEHSRESRFPKDSSAKKLTVTIYAVGQDKCRRVRNTLSQAIKDEFLFQESLKKATHINKETKVKVIAVLTKYELKSVPGKDCYIIKGHKDSVNKAIKEIYEILFDAGTQAASSVQEKRQKRTRVKRETREYVKFMVTEDPDVPEYWKYFKPGHPIKSVLTDIKMAISGKQHKKVTLDAEDRVYKCIVNMINSTWDNTKKGQGQDAVGLGQCNYSQLFVTKIERIENLDLYQEYANCRTKFFRNLHKQQQARYPDITKISGCTGPIQSLPHARALQQDMNPEVNEYYFFHGTKGDNIGVICNQGLDNRLASGQAMFGQGVYGAETCTKADQYADDKTKRTCGPGNSLHMFLIRIILGDAYICTNPNPHKYKRAPCRTCYTDGCKKHEALFDSVIGDCQKLFREFVVYSREQCYPEYLITYERR